MKTMWRYSHRDVHACFCFHARKDSNTEDERQYVDSVKWMSQSTRQTIPVDVV